MSLQWSQRGNEAPQAGETLTEYEKWQEAVGNNNNKTRMNVMIPIYVAIVDGSLMTCRSWLLTPYFRTIRILSSRNLAKSRKKFQIRSFVPSQEWPWWPWILLSTHRQSYQVLDVVSWAVHSSCIVWVMCSYCCNINSRIKTEYNHFIHLIVVTYYYNMKNTYNLLPITIPPFSTITFVAPTPLSI